MALALVKAAAGSPTANSYATAAEADAFFEGHVSGATWAARELSLKERSLVHATRLLDAHVVWDGFIYTQQQSLAWPRYGMTDPITRNIVPNNEIPKRLIYAVSEFAGQLAAGDRTTDSEPVVRDIRSLESIKFGGNGVVQVIPDAVWYWIPYEWVCEIRDRRSPAYQVEWGGEESWFGR